MILPVRGATLLFLSLFKNFLQSFFGGEQTAVDANSIKRER